MMYVFTDDQEIKKNGQRNFSSPRFFLAEPVVVLANTISGQITFNDTLFELAGKSLFVRFNAF